MGVFHLDGTTNVSAHPLDRWPRGPTNRNGLRGIKWDADGATLIESVARTRRSQDLVATQGS